LPSLTSHRTQVLDYSIFSPFKTHLRNALNERTILNAGSNDVYTLCEMLHTAYKQSVTYSNILNGFNACGIWRSGRGGVDPNVIKLSDLHEHRRI